MKNSADNRVTRQVAWSALRTGIFGAVFIVYLVCAWASAQEASQKSAVAPEQQKRIEALKAKGPDASLTVLPLYFLGQPLGETEKASALAVIVGELEMAGVRNITATKTAFKPDDKTYPEGLADNLGEFVRKNRITTDYALFVANLVTEASWAEWKIGALRAVIVDKDGALVWSDSQTAQDEAFKRLKVGEAGNMPKLLVEWLSPLFGLNAETRKAAQPKSAWALVRKGQNLSNAKKNQEALETFQKAAALDSSISEAWMGQTGVLDEMKRKEESWAVYDKWIAARPDYPFPLVYKGMIAAQTGRQAEALKAFEKLTELRPTESWWAGRAEMLYCLDRKNEALAVLDEAVIKAPKHMEVWRGRGWLLIEKKKYDEAVKSYSGAIENLPKNAEFWHGRARAYTQLGETAKALADLKQALELDPGLKGQTAKDVLLKPLQDNAEFKALTK